MSDPALRRPGSPGELLRVFNWLALQGFGGVLPMGCTIRQGIPGFSPLALRSLLTFVAIVIGSAATMKVQYAMLMRAEG